MQNNYALTLIVRPNLDEKERQELLASIVKKFEKTEKEDIWGLRDLSYSIKKHAKGFYTHYLFSADPAKIAGLDKALKLDEDIIRYLLVRI